MSAILSSPQGGKMRKKQPFHCSAVLALTLALSALWVCFEITTRSRLNHPVAATAQVRVAQALAVVDISSGRSTAAADARQQGASTALKKGLESSPSASEVFAEGIEALDLSSKSREWFLTHPSLQCCTRNQMPSQKRVAQVPFVSGDTFRSMADHVLGEYPDNLGRLWGPADVKHGDIIFVKIDYVRKFFRDRHPHINATYILITHNGDLAAPVETRRNHCYNDTCTRYLKDPQLGHWYAKNMKPGYGPKTTPLPIGMGNHRFPFGDFNALRDVALSAPAWESRRTTIYVAMKNETNRVRGQTVKVLGSLPGVHIVRERVNYTTYLSQMANAKFVAAPPGSGMDTYRACEAIYMGTVPIILRGPLDWLYKDLPALLVNDYSEVTTALLDNYAKNRPSHQNTDKVWAIYWHQELKRRQRMIRAAAAAH